MDRAVDALSVAQGPPGASLHGARGGTDDSLAGFEAERDALLRAMERFPGGPIDGAWPDHPSLGSMSRRAWMRWGWRHADHHLCQFGV